MQVSDNRTLRPEPHASSSNRDNDHGAGSRVYDGYRMQAASYWIIGVMMLPGVTCGQQISNAQVTVLTVCEVLGDLNRYADNVIAVVGRLERSVSVIDHYEFLSQDRCKRPVITYGHVWSNKIQVLVEWEEGMPRPPTDSPQLEKGVVAAKLSAVRKTAKLGSHQEPRFRPDGSGSTVAVPNQWAVVYGRIVKSPRLDEDCGAGGCGGDDVPVMIATRQDELRMLTRDGRMVPEEK